MKSSNVHTTRESWLRAGTNELRPDFEKLGYHLPEKIRFAIAFTSTGKRGNIPGECWHSEASNDQHYEVIIRADMDDPVEVLGVLAHELVHTLLPPAIKHGKEFKTIAHRIGLEGAMRHTQPTPLLRQRLEDIAAILGPLPHAKLNFKSASEAPKKQKSRHLKAVCGAEDCEYRIQLSSKCAKIGLPVCPANSKHGKLICKSLDNDSEDIDAS